MIENILIAVFASLGGFALAALCSASHQGQAEQAGSEMLTCLQTAMFHKDMPTVWCDAAHAAMKHWMEA